MAFEANATITDTLVRKVPRAGIVFESSSGLLERVSTLAGKYGFVAQGEPRPDYKHPSNSFVGGEQPVITDGDLPVPGPPPLPD